MTLCIGHHGKARRRVGCTTYVQFNFQITPRHTIFLFLFFFPLKKAASQPLVYSGLLFPFPPMEKYRSLLYTSMFRCYVDYPDAIKIENSKYTYFARVLGKANWEKTTHCDVYVADSFDNGTLTSNLMESLQMTTAPSHRVICLLILTDIFLLRQKTLVLALFCAVPDTKSAKVISISRNRSSQGDLRARCNLFAVSISWHEAYRNVG